LRTDSEAGLKTKVKLAFAPLQFSETIHQQIADYIREHDIGLVLVDTLPAWWGLDDENSASEVLRKGIPLLNMIRQTDAAWLCFAHTRKSGGENGQEVRRSSALVGLVDIAITMKRTEAGGNQRLLESVSRYADTPPKLVLTYQDGQYRPLGTPDAISALAKANTVLEALSYDDGQTVEELVTVTRLSKHDVPRAITLLRDKVYRTGEGKKGRAYEYFRAQDSSSLRHQGVKLGRIEFVTAEVATMREAEHEPALISPQAASNHSAGCPPLEPLELDEILALFIHILSRIVG
jgi:hypothetical protein